MKKIIGVKQMKKIIGVLIFCITIFMFCYTYAASTYELELEVINNKKNEKIDIYVLLPEEYITFAIEESYSTIHYTGSETLKQNNIYGIKVDKQNVLDEEYVEEDDVEYVQILLEEQDGKYKFDILENYKKKNIKFRLVSDQKDYIIHIDNFEIQKDKCEIEYNYEKDVVKQADRIVVPTITKILMVILVIVLVIGSISYIKQRREG